MKLNSLFALFSKRNNEPQNTIYDLTAQDVVMTRINKDSYEFAINFDCEYEVEYAWQLYDISDREKPIEKHRYSQSKVKLFILEELNEIYLAKLFIRNKNTKEKRSLWVGDYMYSDKVISKCYRVKKLSINSLKTLLELINLDLFFIVKDPTVFTKKLLYKGFNISLPFDWSMKNIESRTIRGEIQSFRIFGILISKYEETEDDKYLDILFSYVTDWLNNYESVSENVDEEMFQEFFTSRRVVFFSCIYYLYQDNLNEALRNRIYESIKDQVMLLSQNQIYKWGHNHGMYQDEALLIYCCLIGSKDNNAHFYYNLAKKRLKIYFDKVITKDGVHREHSPSYHRDIGKTACKIKAILAGCGDEMSEYFNHVCEITCQFMIDIIMPDFTYPSIGDSPRGRHILKEWNDNEEYLFISSNGKKGVMPRKNFALYEDGGYCVMRSSWKEKPWDATYILLTAATHSKAHKQNDDLNFLIYHKGDFITEAGKRNYDYMDEATEYTYSSYGHNVLLVNSQGWPMSEKNLPIIDGNAYKTKITSWENKDDLMKVTAVSYRWPDIKQQRSIAYYRNEERIVVTDVLEVMKESCVRLIYHISDGIEVIECRNGWICKRNGEVISEIIVDCNSKYSIDMLKGKQTSGRCSTRIFEGKIQPRYGALLMIDLNCPIGIEEVRLQINLK